jgi:hypothetical protein
LQEQLKPHFIPYEKGKCPSYLKNFKAKSGETPDVWIDEPKNSKIIEVKAYEFVRESDMYSCTYTLRFPRVKRIREDKAWYECLDMKQLQAMVTLSQQRKSNINTLSLISSKSAKHCQRTMATATARTNREGRNRKDIVTLENFLLGIEASSVEVKSNLFKGKEFVIFNCQDPFTKPELERMILSHSGTCVQNPTERTCYILACKEKSKFYKFIYLVQFLPTYVYVCMYRC